MIDTIAICFYGSSDHALQEGFADFYKEEINKIIVEVLKIQTSNLKIITGGYGGIMNLIAEEIHKNKPQYLDKTIEVIGITCDIYEFEDPGYEKYNPSNDYSKYNDVIIQSENFADSIQIMNELSDLFIVLPGKQGTLGELLITYEFNAHNKSILNDRKATLIVHEYWKPLLTNEITDKLEIQTYFREFPKDSLSYFNKNTFANLLSSLLPDNQCSIRLKDRPNRDIPLSDFVESKFINLKNNINKCILGRLYDENTILERLDMSYEAPLLGLDFGWILTDIKKPKDGGFYTYSTDEYVKTTEEFFETHNSIMLNDYENDFEVAFLNGILKKNGSLSLSEGNTIPKKETKKINAEFKDLKDFFNRKRYGQTLIWRGFKVTSNTNYGANKGEKGNEFIFSVFLLLNHRVPSVKVEKIRYFIDQFLLDVSSTKAGELFQKKESEIINQAVRAAISQVMARNTAHNIASHVLAQLTDGDFLSKEKNQEWTCTSYDPQFVSDARIIYQIASLISYIKDRMEYLGDITFGIPSMQANKKLSEIHKELDKVWLLLDHISGLSDFSYKIIFRVNDEDVTEHNDIAVAMTNDVLGTQALFNIIENVIRNTAKHNQNKTKGGTTTFYVNFKDHESDYYEVEIYDDVHVSENKEFDDTEESNKKKVEYHSKTKTKTEEDISNIDWLVYTMNNKINCSVLDEDNKLRGHSLGILEMEASAAYLRKMDIIDIEKDEYDVTHCDSKVSVTGELNILKAFKKEHIDCRSKTCLAYRIFISKPKEYLFVGFDEDLKIDSDRQKELNKLGIDFISTDDFKNKLEDGTVYHHQFVFHKGAFEPTPKQKTQLPLRILELKEEGALLGTLKTANFSEIERQVWTIWFDKIKEKYNYDYDTVNVVASYDPTQHSQGKPYNICYLPHAEGWTNILPNYDANIKSLEPLSSVAQQKLPLFKHTTISDYIYSTKKNNLIKIKLFESASSKILVIDERIQRFAKTDYGNILNKDIFSKTNITIPADIHKLDADNYDPTFKGILITYIDRECEKGGYEFMLIHFSILERLFEENPSKIETKLQKWSEKTRVVVTSGRGRPKEHLPPEVCFVNLSSVLRVFTQARNKYSINYLLNQARK